MAVIAANEEERDVLANNDLAIYLSENYGQCELGSEKCYHGPGPRCLSQGWLGTSCPHWKPMQVTTWEELIELPAAYRRIPHRSGGE